VRSHGIRPAARRNLLRLLLWSKNAMLALMFAWRSAMTLRLALKTSRISGQVFRRNVRCSMFNCRLSISDAPSARHL